MVRFDIWLSTTMDKTLANSIRAQINCLTSRLQGQVGIHRHGRLIEKIRVHCNFPVTKLRENETLTSVVATR